MSAHRDFTPDDDPDELLLSASRPDGDTKAHGPSMPLGDAPPAQVTSIRLKISGSGNASRAGSKPLSAESADPVKHEDDDVDMEERPMSSSAMVDSKPDVARKLPKISLLKKADAPTGSRKRVLSNPSEPPASATSATPTSRKRPKVAAARKPKRKPASHQALAEPVDPKTVPSPGRYMADGDDLLADELSLMDEEVAKRSTRGSSPQYRDHDLDRDMPPMVEPKRQVSPYVPLPSESAVGMTTTTTTTTRMTPESSPEITLLENKEIQRPVLVPIPAAIAPTRKKRKAWLTQKTVPVAIAPNPGSNNAVAGASTDPYTQTPPTAGPSEKRKVNKRSRAFKSSAMVSSPHLEPVIDPEQAYGGGGEMYLDHAAEYPQGDPAGELGSDAQEVKPKKKKSKKLRPGEVGPGKHWRKGVFGPHSARQFGPDGLEIGGESPHSTPGGSQGGRLILPKPAAGGGESRRSLMFPHDGDSTYDAGTPEYEAGGAGEYDHGGSMRSSPEVSMRNDPSISRPLLHGRGSQMMMMVPPPMRAKPLLEGANGQYIVPKVHAQVDDLGHPVYRNSILTRGISIIRIQDHSGPKAKERELTVPKALKDNLGPRARQFVGGCRVITGVGGARLKFKSWIPRTATSEYRLERDAKVEEIRAREAALVADNSGPSRPGLWATASNSQRNNASHDGNTPDPSYAFQQAQIHPGQQVRKISAYAPPGEADATPPKKPPVKKKKKKKVIKSAPELVPDMPSPLLDSVAPSSVASPDVQLNDPMDMIPPPAQASRRVFREVSPIVDDLIMETV